MKHTTRNIFALIGLILSILIMCSGGCERQNGYCYIEMNSYPRNSTSVYEIYTLRVGDHWSYLNTEDVVDPDKKERRITFVFIQ